MMESLPGSISHIPHCPIDPIALDVSRGRGKAGNSDEEDGDGEDEADEEDDVEGDGVVRRVPLPDVVRVPALQLHPSHHPNSFPISLAVLKTGCTLPWHIL